MNRTVVIVLVSFLRRVLQVFCCVLLGTTTGTAVAGDFFYTVRPGDHPWNLAQRYLKNPALGPRLLQLNQIPDEHRLMPGTRLRIPHGWLKLRTAEVRLLAVYGDATLAQDNGIARAAVPGELLQAPVTLRTGAAGSATLGFADGSRVFVGRDSELQLRQIQQRLLSNAGLVELVLLQGNLENQVMLLGDSGGRFEIRTPAAVAAVRGTDYRVHARGTEMHTEVLSGAVNVTNATGQVNAAAGQGSVAQSGQSPSPPTPLLAAPNLDGLPERIERLPIDLPLTALAGARAYRTQLAPDAQFSVVVSDEIVPAARVRARDVDDGSYVLRVRAIDARGLEGFSAQRTVVVHARPEPPLLIEPAPESVTVAPRPSFRWTQAEPARRYRYRLQIMNGSGGTLVDEQVLSSGVNPQSQQDLPAGPYQWRVAAIHPEKGQGPWGDAQPFRRVLPGPGVEPPQVKDGTLILRWSSQAQTARYRLQVSRDTAFAAPLADVQTDIPQYGLKDMTPGTHHVRVQATGTDGYTGPWGSTQTFVVPEAATTHWGLLLLLLPLLGLL